MRARWPRRNERESEPSVSAAVARFAVAGMIGVALVGVAGFVLMRNIGNSEATENAGELTRVIGQGVVEPQLTEALIRGEPEAVERFDQMIKDTVLKGEVVRVKLWDDAGRIVYSDEQRLIGDTFELGDEEQLTLRTGAADSEVSDLSEPENRFDRDSGKLLEAYSRVGGPDGQPLLFETYQQYSSVTSSGRSLWLAFAPALIVGLILLYLVQLPLATSLARRVRGAHRDRLHLLERAIDASDRERRRIAGDLHDGAVQDLAGVALSLEGAARRLEERNPEAAGTLRRGAEQTRGSVRSLRNLLVEIYPPSLQRAGLRSALEDLLAPIATRGIDTELDFDENVRLDVEEEALCFRVTQESLRNTLKHADASRVDVRLAPVSTGIELAVMDDGLGFKAVSMDQGRAEPLASASVRANAGNGHIGTHLMADLAAEAGAKLAIESGAGQGTVVRLLLPRP